VIDQHVVIRGLNFSSHSFAPIFFPFFFVGMWCFACFMISRFGWSTWAESFRCDRELVGKNYRGRSGRFNLQGSYKGVLNVVLCNEGIGLSVMLPWRVGHPPLLIPWSKVTGVEGKNYFLFKLLQVTISDTGKIFRFELPLSAKPEFETRTLAFRGPLHPQTPPPL
jgi:hypothetical protein